MINNKNNNLTFIIRLENAMQTPRRWSLHIGKTYDQLTIDQHLEACCRGISSCYAGYNPKIPWTHWHCYQYLNGAKLRLSVLHLMIADVGLLDAV